MRPVTLIVLASLCACASAGPSTSGRSTETVRVAGSGIGMTLTPNGGASVTNVAFSSEQVWRIMPAVFESLGISLTTVDPQKHVIGNEGFKVRKQLGTVTLSKYIECGTTQIGPNADSYEVYMTILTSVQPGPSGGTAVGTTVEAAARPLTVAQEYSRCSSKSLLESKIIDAINAKMRK
ncbi:MAG: hypothetical protein ABJF01_17100 [bacterium]